MLLLPLLTLPRPWRPYRRCFLMITAFSLAIASTWIIRNAVDFHRFIPIAASGYGTNLLVGTMATREQTMSPVANHCLTAWISPWV